MEVPHYDPSSLACERLEATSHDGCKVPISVVYSKAALPNGCKGPLPDGKPLPCLLYGYGCVACVSVWLDEDEYSCPLEPALKAHTSHCPSIHRSYGACIDPSFDSNRLALLERGIVFAIAHIRGGGEMGRAWCVVVGVVASYGHACDLT